MINNGQAGYVKNSREFTIQIPDTQYPAFRLIRYLFVRYLEVTVLFSAEKKVPFRK